MLEEMRRVRRRGERARKRGCDARRALSTEASMKRGAGGDRRGEDRRGDPEASVWRGGEASGGERGGEPRGGRERARGRRRQGSRARTRVERRGEAAVARSSGSRLQLGWVVLHSNLRISTSPWFRMIGTGRGFCLLAGLIPQK